MSVFDAIKTHVASGGDINRFSSHHAVLFLFLDRYYRDAAFGGADAPAETELPLEERPSGILPQLEWLLRQGAEVNAGGQWLPLMPAVACLDAPMTAWLLAHGADPFVPGASGGCGNYYMDELDLTLLEESRARRPRAAVYRQALTVAALLASRGVTNIHGSCIAIDGQTAGVLRARARV